MGCYKCSHSPVCIHREKVKEAFNYIVEMVRDIKIIDMPASEAAKNEAWKSIQEVLRCVNFSEVVEENQTEDVSNERV